MKFSISLMNFGYLGDMKDLVDVAVEAEESGWDAVFLADHVNWKDAGFHLDPWIALGLIADRTSRVLIGTAITPVPRRRPTKIAREILTLHQYSGGRFIFGAGSGLWNSEFADLGDEGDMKVRAEMLDEGLELLQKTWSGEAFEHAGTHYRAKGETFAPGGADIPIWVGASWPSRKPFRRAARFDGVMAMNRDFHHSLSPDDVRDMSHFIAKHRDTNKPFNLGVAITSSDDAAADIDRAHAYSDAGADWWQEGVFPAAESLAKLLDIVRRGPPRS
jgi:alkanesulfonate monooxygenase SsuD/methylene tetrahydromethanopterin reductase-like flavin-dependent oxidoreductase (luciferase family)